MANFKHIHIIFHRVTSTFLSTEDLAVTFENGHSLLMNLNSPQYLYMVDEFKGDTLKNRTLTKRGQSMRLIVVLINGYLLEVANSYRFQVNLWLLSHYVSILSSISRWRELKLKNAEFQPWIPLWIGDDDSFCMNVYLEYDINKI